MADDIKLEPVYRSLVNKSVMQHATERVTLLFIALGIATLLVLFFFQNSELKTSLHNQQVQQQITAQQTKQIKSFVLCIAQFFTESNRQSTTLQASTCNSTSKITL